MDRVTRRWWQFWKPGGLTPAQRFDDVLSEVIDKYRTELAVHENSRDRLREATRHE